MTLDYKFKCLVTVYASSHVYMHEPIYDVIILSIAHVYTLSLIGCEARCGNYKSCKMDVCESVIKNLKH